MYQMVGSKPKGASPYGCMDMAGNGYDLTCEWIEPYPNHPESGRMASHPGSHFGRLPGGVLIHCGSTTFYLPIITFLLLNISLRLFRG